MVKNEEADSHWAAWKHFGIGIYAAVSKMFKIS